MLLSNVPAQDAVPSLLVLTLPALLAACPAVIPACSGAARAMG